MKAFAAEGRTVFVSSHLMSEMALTADHLIVIGRGRLLADLSTADFIKHSSQNFVRVRSPQATELAAALTGAGANVQAEDDGALKVTELEMERIGDLAADAGLRIHELSAQQASLEAAFMELTGEAVEYHGHTTNEAAPGAPEAQPPPVVPGQPGEKRETEVVGP
jgi:ABC-2 type transport system ATP-binding protein